MIITNDAILKKLANYSNKNTKLAREVRDGKIIKIVNGLYETDSNTPGYLLAGSIYGPSYISFEYALAKDSNDNLDDAKELVKLLKGMLCHVNLIPINKIENGKYTKSTNDNIIRFRDYLNDHGIVATIRRELGSDIDAACGQLRRQNLQS